MYARGMTIREIQCYLAEMYGTEVSLELISKVTGEVTAENIAWQSRPLEPVYPVVFFDVLRVKIRDDAVARNKAVYLALGVLPDSTRDVLGIWTEQTEGAKFWLKVFNDLRGRSFGDILIAVVDGLKGLSKAIEAAFPVPRYRPASCSSSATAWITQAGRTAGTWLQRCVRSTQGATAEAAQEALEEFASAPGARSIQRSHNPGAAPGRMSSRFFSFSPDVRKVIYTTDAIESLHMQLRQIIKS